MANNNYNLIDGLFGKQTSSTSQASSASSTAEEGYTKRTWKIKDELWEDFTALADLSHKKQFELINDLIAQAIEENTKRISEYQKFFSKK